MPSGSAEQQAREASNSTILLAYLNAERRQRDKWGREMFPILKAEVRRRGLDLSAGRLLRDLRKTASEADQRSHAIYDHQGAAGGSGIAASTSLRDRLWAEAKALEAEIDA